MANKILLNFGVGLATVMMCAGTAYAGNMGHSSYTPDLLPPNPQTGECYARVKIPAQYETRNQTVLVEEGYSKLQVSQPELRSRQEQVMVKEASVEYRVRQPRYSTVTEQIMVRPAYEKLSVSSPQFKTVTETINVSQPRLVWKKGNPAKLKSQGYVIHSTADAGYAGQGYRSTTQYGQAQLNGAMHCGSTCEIWCLVEEPGQSVSYNRKVLSNPGQVTRHTVPAKYQTITKQVVADPGGVEQIPVPAQYRSVTVEDVVHPGGETYVDVPAKYGDVSVKVPVSDERYEWRRVVCQPGTHPQGRVSSGSTSYSSGSSYNSGSSYSSGTTYSSGTHHSTSYGQTSGTHSVGTTTTYGSSAYCGGKTTCNSYPSSSSKREKYRYRR